MKTETKEYSFINLLFITIGSFVVMALTLIIFYGIVLLLEQLLGMDRVPMDTIRQIVAVVLLLLYVPIFFSKMRDDLKAILLAGPLAFGAFTGYLMYYETPLVALGISAFIILLVAFLFFQYKKPWYYYYVILLSIVGMLILR